MATRKSSATGSSVLPIRIAALGILLLISIAAGYFYSQLWGRHLEKALHLDVPRGASGKAVLHDLEKRRVISSTLPAQLYLRVRGGSIRWGSYSFPPGISVEKLLSRLIEGRVDTLSVTIPEGARALEIGDLLDAAGIRAERPWKEIIRSTRWIADLAPDAATLEGFLFPDTYHVDSGLDSGAVARQMIQNFRGVWAEERAAVSGDGRSLEDILTLASLVESETGVSSERARIAGVYLNRLRKGMLLQCDPTVIYALERHGLYRGTLSRRDLKFDDPYNTYLRPGLPPGPICNPGRAAIRAAIQPEKHSYLYFVAAGDGGHRFSRTLKEHNRAVADYRRMKRKKH